MPCLGLTVRIKEGCPHLRVVFVADEAPADPLLEAPPGADTRAAVHAQPKVIDTFEYLASKDRELADQIHDLADAFQTRLTGLGGSGGVIVVREADDARQAGLDAARKARLRVEGAVLAVARGRTTQVRVMNGQQVGRALGGSKAEVEARAATLVNATWKEAAAAALAARVSAP